MSSYGYRISITAFAKKVHEEYAAVIALWAADADHRHRDDAPDAKSVVSS
jgi:hypothetical protein